MSSAAVLSYIVQLKDGVDKAIHLEWLKGYLGKNSRVIHIYEQFKHLYAAEFDKETLAFVRASPDVQDVQEDSDAHISPSKECTHIVQVKKGADMAKHLQWLQEHLSGESSVVHVFDHLNMYAGIFDDKTIALILGSSDVQAVEKNGPAHILPVPGPGVAAFAALPPILPISDKYIITLKEGVDKKKHFHWLREHMTSDCEVTDVLHSLNMYIGRFNEETVQVIRTSSDVKHVTK
ncbi:hypothetical protein M422DRAFT_247610, partial [Sphaerobolus stellatus SS14]